MNRTYVGAGLLFGLLLTACGSAAAPAPTSLPAPSNAPAATGKIVNVVTTMSILNDLVKQVGGERVSTKNIIPIGAGVEDYQPKPEDAKAIGAADVVFYNGFGLEEWLTDLFASAGKPNQPRLAAAAGLSGIEASDAFKQGNPHFWLDAKNGIKYVENIRDGLSQVDPAGKDLYAKNAAAYSAKLTALDAELRQEAESLPPASRKLVTDHDAFPYFAAAYGFTVVGAVLPSPGVEPSAGDLAKLVELIKQEQVKAIFSETQFSPKLAETIGKEAGINVVSDLLTDSIGEKDGGSYIEMLRYNMRTIVAALK